MGWDEFGWGIDVFSGVFWCFRALFSLIDNVVTTPHTHIYTCILNDILKMFGD